MSSNVTIFPAIFDADKFASRRHNRLPIKVRFNNFTVVVDYSKDPDPGLYELDTWIEGDGERVGDKAAHTLYANESVETGVRESATNAVHEAVVSYLTNRLQHDGTEAVEAELYDDEDTPPWVLAACVEALDRHAKTLHKDIAAQTPEVYEAKRLRYIGALQADLSSTSGLSTRLQKELRARQR